MTRRTARRRARRWSAARAVTAALVAGCAVAACGPGPSAGSGPTRPTGDPWHPVFFGVDVPSAEVSAVAAFADAVGTRPSVSSLFVRYDSTRTAQVVDETVAAGLVPFVTLEPWHLGATADHPDPRDSLAALLSGRYDAQLVTQARALARSPVPVYLRFAHEMNGTWYPWALGVGGNTARQYVAAWRHVHALLARRVPSLRARWVFAPNILSSGAVSSDLASLYPGPDVVDVLGLTGYEHRGSSPSDTFRATVEALSRLGPQPVVLAEIGVEGPGKRTWLRGLGDYLRSTGRISGFVYFDTTPETTGATGRYALGPGDLPAFRATLDRLTEKGPRSGGAARPPGVT